MLFLLFIDRASFSIGYLKQLAPFILLLLAGFIGTLVYRYEIVNIVKDIFHFIKPIAGLLIGYLVFKKINNLKLFIQTLVIAGVISAGIHLFIIASLVRFSSGNINAIREFTKDNLLELFSFIFLLFYRRFFNEHLFKSKLYSWAMLGILFMSATLYFSRTMFVAGAILLLAVYGYARISRKTLIAFGIVLLVIGGLYTYLYSTNIRRDKPGLEALLYKVKIAPEEIFKTRVNRANHKELWDHWRGYEAGRAYRLLQENPSGFIVGMGHGSLVDLKFHAPLTGDKKGIRYISELHNGFMYLLYKTGIIGLLIYLFILVRWYLKVYEPRSFVVTIISAIAIIYFISSLTITGAYNTKDVMIFIMGGLLYYGEIARKRSTLAVQTGLQ